MKRKFVIYILLFICCFPVMANPNYQQIIPASSPVWTALEALYVQTGHAAPPSSGPWSVDELLLALEKIDVATLSPVALDLYDYVADALRPRELIGAGSAFSMNIGGDVDLNMIVHTNPATFDKESDWLRPIVSSDPFLTVFAETWVDSVGYAYGEISLGFTRPVASIVLTDTPKGHDSREPDLRYSSFFATNIPFVSPGSFSMNFPYRGLISIGTSHWNLLAGRDVARWGTGKTGNLMIGGNLPFNDMVRLSAYTDWFKYTFLLSFFTHPMNIGKAHTERVEGLQFLMAHRLEFRFWQDRIGLAIQESIMYQSEDGTVNPQIFNPLLLFHNYYIGANANSLAGVELDFTPFSGLNFYFQFVMDDVAVFGEPKQPESGASPDAFGYLLGVRGMVPHGSGYWYGTLEGVYTDPFLYLRERAAGHAYGYLDYVGVTREFDAAVGYQTRYLREYITYRYGGDAIVGDLSFGYSVPASWHAECETFFMAHGVVRSDSAYGQYTGTEQVPHTPSTNNPFSPGENGAVEYTLSVGLHGGWQPLGWLSIQAGADVVTQWNRWNIERSATMDVQFFLGVSCKL
ncbi:MAG: hypothetical protein SPD11_00845 [Sphaerochaetaceae bacterium]|nr:hypothetical protein [Sphaerochaetaceae bacterium]